MVTESRDLYEKMKLVRSHGRLETADYFSSCDTMDYVTLGYNFRLSNIAASLGRAQLRKVDDLIRMRKDIANRYLDQCTSNKVDITSLSPPDEYDNVYQLFSVRVPNRDGLMKHLTEKGIMSKIYFAPVHQTHYYQKVLGYTDSLPVTEKNSRDIISLPMYPGMPQQDVDTIVIEMAKFYEGR